MALADYATAFQGNEKHAVAPDTPPGRTAALCGVFVNFWGADGRYTFADYVAAAARWKRRNICGNCKKAAKTTTPATPAPAPDDETTKQQRAAIVAEVERLLDTLAPLGPDKIAARLHAEGIRGSRYYGQYSPVENYVARAVPDGYTVEYDRDDHLRLYQPPGPGERRGQEFARLNIPPQVQSFTRRFFGGYYRHLRH